MLVATSWQEGLLEWLVRDKQLMFIRQASIIGN